MLYSQVLCKNHLYMRQKSCEFLYKDYGQIFQEKDFVFQRVTALTLLDTNVNLLFGTIISSRISKSFLGDIPSFAVEVHVVDDMGKRELCLSFPGSSSEIFFITGGSQGSFRVTDITS